jgi:spore coat polysaccharide biosynthesis protein SpsF
MRYGVLLSVREKSTRLPGKVMAPIFGKSVTEHLVERLKLARLADKVVIATSDDPRDCAFDSIGAKCGVDVFHGSQDDKLLRYRDAAHRYGFDHVLVVDGDDLLCFPEYIDELIKKSRAEPGWDALFIKGLPLGAAASLLSRRALDRVIEMKDESDTEVWGGYFIGSGHFDVGSIEAQGLFNHPEIRMTLDYQEDMDFFVRVFEELYPADACFTSQAVMDLLVNRKPEIAKINEAAQSKYERHITSAAAVKFKAPAPSA